MTTIPKRPDLTFYQRGVVLLTLCALAGCDAFLVSICEFKDLQTCNADASSDSNLAPTTDQIPVIEERRFIHLDSRMINGNYKFNGILDNRLLTMAKAMPPKWEAWRLDSNNHNTNLITTDTRGTPPIPLNFNFSSDEINITGGKFFYLQHDSNGRLFELIGNLAPSQITNVNKLTVSPQPRTFAHPFFNALVVATDPLPQPNRYAFIYIKGSKHYLDFDSLTSFVIGDLDSNDMASNGEEIIAFQEDIPKTVIHWDQIHNPSEIDNDLLTSLQRAIVRTQTAGPIRAAFIANLNNDQFPDFIYARDKQIYVTSYLGHDKSVDLRFKNWTESVAEFTDETINSLAVVSLADNAYPELVVETDKAVHVYLNSPKGE